MKQAIIRYLAFSLILTAGLFGQGRTVDDAKFINQSIPDRMSPGQSYTLIVTFENTGTTAWTPNDYSLRINPGKEDIKSIWSVDEFPIGKFIEKGNTVSFEVKVVSPTAEGVYPFNVQMMHGLYIFGEASKQVDISVSSQVNLSDALNSAAFVEQSIPPVMEAGRPYKVMISMTNTGKTTWTKGMYRLVLIDASGNAYTGGNWNTYSVSLDEDIKPGSTKVFNFELVPVSHGSYTLQWRMTSSDAGLFGDATNPAVISVK